jgi:hypothetical protein
VRNCTTADSESYYAYSAGGQARPLTAGGATAAAAVELRAQSDSVMIMSHDPFLTFKVLPCAQRVAALFFLVIIILIISHNGYYRR